MLRESDGMRTRRRREAANPAAPRLPDTTARLVTFTITATAAARAAALAGTDPGLIPFTAALALIRAHVAADTCCPRCGHRPADSGDPLAGLLTAIVAQPRHREGRQRTSGRTPAERRIRHTEEVTYTIDITESNLPQWDENPESKGSGFDPDCRL